MSKKKRLQLERSVSPAELRIRLLQAVNEIEQLRIANAQLIQDITALQETLRAYRERELRERAGLAVLR